VFAFLLSRNQETIYMSSNVIFLSINRGFGCEASWKMLIVHRLAFFPFPFPDLLLEFAFSYFFDREPETASNLRSSPGDGAQRSAAPGDERLAGRD